MASAAAFETMNRGKEGMSLKREMVLALIAFVSLNYATGACKLLEIAFVMAMPNGISPYFCELEL